MSSSDPIRVLINPLARRAGAPDWGRVLSAGLAGLAWEAEDLGATDEALREQVTRASGASGLIVVGGDGSVSLVASSVVELGLADRLFIGLVPGGTCNDVARVLGISRPAAGDLDGWAGVVRGAAMGPVRAVDLGRVNDRVFINHAGIGRDYPTYERLARRKAWLRRGRLPGPLVSLIHSLETALRFQPNRCAVVLDGRRLGARELYMALALNGPYFSGGLSVTTDTDMADGRLDFALVHAAGKARLLRWLASGLVRIGAASSPPDFVEILRGRRLDLDTEEPVWPQHDGEPPEPEGVRRVRFEIHPSQLRVRVVS